MQIQHVFNKASNVLVITHIDPDGDAIGSLTAVGQVLEQQMKRMTLVCDDAVPERFSFLSLANRVQKAPDRYEHYDLIIAVDCGDVGRMGNAYRMLPYPGPTMINIDHHATNTLFGNVNIVDGKATSTTEILHQLFQELDVELTREIATSLLTGLVTDTLGFRTIGVTARTLQIAGELVDAGADLAFVTNRALVLKPMSALRLWQIGLNQLRVEDGLAWTIINYAERELIGSRSNSSLGLVNLLADVDEVAMGVVLMEQQDGKVRVGFRCRPPYNVADVAEKLGGGGHVLASGCALDCDLSQAEIIVVRLCKEAIRQQTAVAETSAVH